MSYKTVFLDVDGTILRPDHSISDATQEAVYQLQNQGIDVVIATGRPLNATLEVAKQLNISSYITFNGAHAIRGGAEVFQQSLDKRHVDFLLANALEKRHDLLFFQKESNLALDSTNRKVQTFANHLSMSYTNTDKQTDLSHILSGVLLIDRERDIHLYQGRQELHFSRGNVPDFIAYDINASHINKGTAVRSYLAQTGIDAKDAIAFGDGMNDKEMLSFVGMGFAMGNAMSDLLPYANDVTASAAADGIWKGLKKIGLVK